MPLVYTVTAAADVANGRVAVTAQGGVPGSTLYLFRRDSGGVGVVRDTSGGDVVWPAWLTPRTNLALDPGFEYGIAGITAGGVSASVTQQPSGGRSGKYLRLTAGTAAAAASADGIVQPIPVTPGQQYAISAYVRGTVGRSAYLRAVWTGGPAATTGTLTAVASATLWTQRYTLTGTVPVGATTMRVDARLDAAGVVVGNVLEVDDLLVELGTATVGAQFSGDTANALPTVRAWAGVPGASVSLEGQPQPLVVNDNEARQGLQTDYILADTNGLQLATYRIDVPLWGTWLKSPGRPYLNTRCIFGSEAPVVRKARRASIDIEGAAQPIVLSEARSSRGGALTLAALTLAQAQAMDRLLDDGTTLMLDTPPSWGVAFRYISVGDTTSTRGLSDGQLGLERTERIFSLADVLHVDAPIGVTVVDPGRTYATLPTLYGNYAALAAINPDYTALALGTAD